jgi:hypothetical protein
MQDTTSSPTTPQSMSLNPPSKASAPLTNAFHAHCSGTKFDGTIGDIPFVMPNVRTDTVKK